MNYVTRRQIERLDQAAIKRFGIPSLILMENAGRGIAELAQKMMGRRKNILVVCGKGNNGGDGFAAARHLANRGYTVRVVIFAKPTELKNDPKVNYLILKKMGVTMDDIGSLGKLARLKVLIKKSDLILDAIFGVGLKRPVSGLFCEVIALLNRSGKPVLSIDIHSGLDSNTGRVLGTAVRARVTGTLGVAKRGLVLNEGPARSGKVVVLDISLPHKFL